MEKNWRGLSLLLRSQAEHMKIRVYWIKMNSDDFY